MRSYSRPAYFIQNIMNNRFLLYSCISIMHRLHPHNTIITFHNPVLTTVLVLSSQNFYISRVCFYGHFLWCFMQVHVWSILPLWVHVHVSVACTRDSSFGSVKHIKDYFHNVRVNLLNLKIVNKIDLECIFEQLSFQCDFWENILGSTIFVMLNFAMLNPAHSWNFVCVWRVYAMTKNIYFDSIF